MRKACRRSAHGRWDLDMKNVGHGERANVRPAVAADVECIRSLSKIAFEQYGPYEKILAGWFQSGIAVTLLAVIEDRPVGFAMLRALKTKSDLHRVSELLAIAVEPEKRNLGIGGLLMKEIEKTAYEMGVQALFLHTAVGNLLGQKFFAKHGFIPLEVRKNFYPKGQDGLMMYKEMGPG
jgi:ribosomal protein S18 acetylase RimI-like enzyme